MGSLLLGAALSLGLAAPLAAEESDDQIVEEIVVVGDLRSLPGENVESVFGFQKSLLELPRSASTVSWEQIERFNIKDIDELVALAPGTFTQSFFGVAGSLDVRGTPGETYFRGIRRLDNPGNYPTPIGAADRVDIVRGPASPIFGPAKIGGFLNFVPKSARADSGQYLDSNEGAISFTGGSWDKSVLTAEVGGPGTIGGRDFGYYLYGEVEDSGSYYDNSSVDQTLIQASFDMDVNDRLRLQWGGMYHDFKGNQVAGWNRLTQDLIDNGTYVTGQSIGLDTDGDGSISHQEYLAQNVNPFFFGLAPDDPATAAIDRAALAGIVGGGDAVAGEEILARMTLQNVGTTQLKGSQVLVAPDDTLENEDIVLYFDFIYALDNGVEIKNQLYYEQYDNLNENAYGFSQFHDTFVIEDKLVISKTHETDAAQISWQLSPSIRYTDFKHGDDFINEYFDRRDVTQESSALDRRLLSTRIDDDYSTYAIGDYTNFGVAGLVDLDFEFGLNITAGLRWDTLDLDSRTPGDLLLFSGPDVREKDTVDGWSWSVSASFETPIGLRPYITLAEQSTIIAGQGAELDPGNIASGGVFDTSELLEGGLKGSLLEDKLYFALSFYKQERTDFSAQSIVTNQSTETEGAEFELRWAVTDKLLLAAGWSKIEVTNLNTLENGSRFSFVGSEDLPGVAPETLYGGTLGAIVFRSGEEGARRSGMPENIYSFNGTYEFTPNFAVHGSVVRADAVNSSFSGTVRLPSYTLVNLGALYQTDHWLLGVNVKNVGNEDYYRANFPNLFGTNIVLPELPRNYTATVQYRF
ncbi:MAG: TonB-dependent receptor [Pseudomonadota bacterium]